MSRSRKKMPGYKDCNSFFKTYANRRLRRLPVDETLSDGKSYRKYGDSWSICDWKWFYYSKNELVRHAEWMFEVYPHKYNSRDHAIKSVSAKLVSK